MGSPATLKEVFSRIGDTRQLEKKRRIKLVEASI